MRVLCKSTNFLPNKEPVIWSGILVSWSLICLFGKSYINLLIHIDMVQVDVSITFFLFSDSCLGMIIESQCPICRYFKFLVLEWSSLNRLERYSEDWRSWWFFETISKSIHDSFAYDSIVEEMRQNLKFEEKNVKWRILEQSLREICRIFKEREGYVRQCMETKNWWAKAIVLYQNSDCVELYIHILPSCIPVVIEAIEIAGEFSGLDHDEIQKKSLVYSNKYQKEWKDPRLFQWKFAKQYFIFQKLCNRYDTVWKEDRWMLLEKKMSGSTK